MARRAAVLPVSCDDCGTIVELPLHSIAILSAWDERAVGPDLRQLGWQTDDTQDLCPFCVPVTEG